MAAKRRRKKKADPIGQLLDGLSLLARAEIVGLSLVVISIFTLLSLLTGSRGSVTGLWIDLLRAATGDGVVVVPLLSGFLGLWMVIRAIDKMPDLPWQKPAGLLLIFLAYITGVTLWLPSMTRTARAVNGEAGGALGLFLADVLEAGLSVWGGWAVVTFSAVLGLVLLTDRLLLDLALDSWDALQELWEERQQGQPEPQVPAIQPYLPLASGEVPLWKRLTSWLQPSGEKEVPIQGNRGTVRGETSQPANSAPGQQTARAADPSAPPAASGLPAGLTPPTPEKTLTPKVVGGLQDWQLPRLEDMLDSWDRFVDSDDLIRQRGRLIEETLALFGVPADFEGVNAGPTVTQYLIRPGYIERTVRGEVKRTKVKVSKIAGLTNDLALALAAQNVRIEAPIPGTNYVGIEVPNGESNNVGLKELMESEEYEQIQSKGRLPIALGEDVKGKPVTADLARMPHLLIAGATGTGKSVCINSIVGCLLLTHTPETLRMLMIDPKMVELTVYNGTPHLLSPVVTDVDRAAGVLFWCVKEMERRYQLLNKAGTRDLERYNAYLRKRGEEILPYIVVVVDEMADLMMAAPEEVEKHIIRLAQMARAVGIHLIIATQRPSVDVITGLIKANFPARIAFAVTSQTDSRVVLDVPGADRLLGRGDMLFMAPDASKLHRMQGAWLSDEEINRIVQYWKGIRSLDSFPDPTVPDLTAGHLTGTAPGESDPAGLAEPDDTPFAPPAGPAPEEEADPWGDPNLIEKRLAEDSQMVQPIFEQIEQLKEVEARDDLFEEAVRVVTEAGRGSVTILQRKLRIGYNRASRLVDQLESAGIVGPDRGGSQGREVFPPAGGSRSPGPGSSDQPKLTPRIIGDDDAPPRVWM